MPNESYDLAVKHVLERIDRQTADDENVTGRLVDIGRIIDCDCVPLSVTDSRGRVWWLAAVRPWHWNVSRLTATYEGR